MKAGRWLSFAVLVLSVVAASSLASAVDVWGSDGRPPGMFFVTDYGAVGDGSTDDSGAFQKAIDAAALTGGTVFVPPVLGEKGYVLGQTVVVKEGISLVGSVAGFSTNAWRAYQEPEQVKGAKILARTDAKEPLFVLTGSNTVRGFWILYDQQPWPTDKELQDKYGYKSFADAKKGFMSHVTACGPTFYVTMGESTCIEDVRADRYYDFFYLKAGARCSVNRIILYGYKRAFVIEQGYDVNRLSNIELVPLSPFGFMCFRDEVVNGRPTGKCLDLRPYTWIYGIIVSQEDNVGLQIGRSDGYTLTNLFFDAVHTGIRLGASEAWPIYEPVEGKELYPSAGGLGPWGEMSNIGIDGCNVGLQFVWPGGMATHISNLIIYPQFDDGKDFTAKTGTGKLVGVSRHAAMIFEDTYRKENNYNQIPAALISNAEIASNWPENRNIAGVGASMCTANGRVFLVAGDAVIEIAGLSLSLDVGPSACRNVDSKSLLIAVADGAGVVSVRVRGYVLNGMPEDDWTWTRK